MTLAATWVSRRRAPTRSSSCKGPGRGWEAWEGTRHSSVSSCRCKSPEYASRSSASSPFRAKSAFKPCAHACFFASPTNGQLPRRSRHSSTTADHISRQPKRAHRLRCPQRIVAALTCPISDCDESYNYWEPAHFLLEGSGFQVANPSPHPLPCVTATPMCQPFCST